MDSVTLTTTAVAFLSPYLVKASEKAAEEVGKKLPDLVGNIWNAITARFKGNAVAEAAVQDFAAKPEDPLNQSAFANQLRKILEAHPVFAAELVRLLEGAQRKSGDTVIMTGSAQWPPEVVSLQARVAWPCEGMYTVASALAARRRKDNTPMPDDEASEVAKLGQIIAGPQDQWCELDLHLSVQIAELQARGEEVTNASQRNSGATATSGDIAAGKSDVTGGGDVFCDIFNVYQSPTGGLH